MQNVHFSPSEIARMIGVNESTVKRWVDKRLLPAFITSGGHRRIREGDLQEFMRSRSGGHHASYYLSRFARTPCETAWEEYYRLHFAGKHREAQQYVTGFMLAHGSAGNTVRWVIAPTLVEIGLAWNRGELDISDEHRMSFRIRGDVYALEALVPTPSPHAPHIMLACVPGENHELALGLLSLTARESGWEPTVLGINVPHTAILHAVRAHTRTRVVVLNKMYANAPDASTYVHMLAHAPTLTGITLLIVGHGWSSSEHASVSTMPGVQVCASGGEVHAYLHATYVQ